MGKKVVWLACVGMPEEFNENISSVYYCFDLIIIPLMIMEDFLGAKYQ